MTIPIEATYEPMIPLIADWTVGFSLPTTSLDYGMLTFFPSEGSKEVSDTSSAVPGAQAQSYEH